MLQYDDSGFLTGSPIHDIRRRRVDDLTRIRRDVAAIRRSLLSAAHHQPNETGIAQNNLNRLSEALSEAARNSRNTSTDNRDREHHPQPHEPENNQEPDRPPINPPQPAAEENQAQPQVINPPVEPTLPPMPDRINIEPLNIRPTVEPSRPPLQRDRDARGRFIAREAADEALAGERRSRNEQSQSTNPNEETPEGRRLNTALSSLLSGAQYRMQAASNLAGGLEDVDPTVRAAREVVEPMQRTWDVLAGNSDKDERWWQKIWKELKGFRKQTADQAHRDERHLNHIEENTEDMADGGGAGQMGFGLFGRLGRLFSPLGRLLVVLGRGFGSLLKKVPIVGGLLSVVLAGGQVFENEKNPNLTRKEKDIKNGGSIGGSTGLLGGAIYGAEIGSAIGPIGTIIGGVVGAYLGGRGGKIIGDKVGEWVNDMRSADIPKMFNDFVTSTQEKWGSFITSIKDKWDGAVKTFESVWEPIKKFFEDKFGIVAKAANKVNEAIKEKTGIDVKANVKSGVKRAKEDFEIGKKAIQEKVKPVVDAVANKVKPIVEPISKRVTEDFNLGSHEIKQKAIEMAKKVPGQLKARWQDAKGFLSKAAEDVGIDPGILAKITNFESGFNSEAKPMTKTGKLLSSAQGYGQFLNSTWTGMLNKYGAKYGVKNAGKLTEKEAQQYRSDKSLQAAMLAEYTNENIKLGRKYGGSNDDANVYALHNLGQVGGKKFLEALKKNPSAPVSSILSNRVIKGNRSLYGNGDITLMDSYKRMSDAMNRGEVFAQDIRKMTPQQQPVMVADASAKMASMQPIPAPATPKSPTMTAIPESEQVITPLATDINSTIRQQAPMINKDDVNQDISDRTLAHIVTGGLANS